MYVITGASGNIGSEIVRKLLQFGKKVRAITRDQNRLKVFADQGAEIRQGPLDDTDFLSDAFEGATAVYAMIPPDITAKDYSAFQDKTGEAIVKALERTKVPNVVHLSSTGAEISSGTGPIAGLHRQEERMNRLNANVLHLRPSYFMENFFSYIPMIREMGMIGSPEKPELKMPIIATRDIGDFAGDRLNQLDFKGKSVRDLNGPRLISMQEATKILGSAIGKPDLAYVQFPYEDAEKGMIQAGLSPSVAKQYVEMTRAENEGLIKPIPNTKENTMPTTLEQFASIFAEAYKAHSKQ
jgi:uncharacterized protein YbjT (DUF2867 family)